MSDTEQGFRVSQSSEGHGTQVTSWRSGRKGLKTGEERERTSQQGFMVGCRGRVNTFVFS